MWDPWETLVHKATPVRREERVQMERQAVREPLEHKVQWVRQESQGHKEA